MTIFIFGNPDLDFDSLPIRILPKLKINFPKVEFVVVDPNEEWNLPENLTVLDTAYGIDQPRVFNDLKNFAQAPRLTMHDFDALSNLRYLQKLGKIKQVKIIGLPPTINEQEALQFLTTTLPTQP